VSECVCVYFVRVCVRACMTCVCWSVAVPSNMDAAVKHELLPKPACYLNLHTN
jgi:hypothetical protein